MPWKESTIMFQKEEFIRKVLAKKTTFSSICTDFDISRTTGYIILKKYKCEGFKGLEPVSRAPYKSPNKTSSKIENIILSVRAKHNTWGPKKILSNLRKKHIEDLPAISTIAEILKRNGCISAEATLKHKPLTRFERAESNELWQMDFKGQFQLAIKESCYPLTIIDDHSRFSLCLNACKNEDIMPVKNQLIRAFSQFGLPKQINVDNGRPWGNSSIVKHTQLTVWLLRLNIRVTHSRPKHPQTNGKLERFHRTLNEDVLRNQIINDYVHAQKLFDQWRKIYNYERPHEAIRMLVPADCYKPSLRRMPDKLEAIEYDTLATVRKVSARGAIGFLGKDFVVGKAFTGYYLEIKPNDVHGKLEFYFGKHKIQTSDLG